MKRTKASIQKAKFTRLKGIKNPTDQQRIALLEMQVAELYSLLGEAREEASSARASAQTALDVQSGLYK